MSWLPTLRAMWSPKGRQVMIPTPGQPEKRYGIGAVNYHTGETVVLFRRRKRRQEVAQLLEALLAKHPTGTVYVAWDNASTHEDDEVDDVVRAAAGRLVLLYLPTYSPWLNPIEMLWAAFPTRGDTLRAVRERQSPAHGRRRLLRPLQPGAAEDAVDHRLECRESSVTVLSRPSHVL